MNKTIRIASKAYFVGDTELDIKTGKNAGCKTIFVLSGREDVFYIRRWDDVEPDFIVKDLSEATKIITGSGSPNIIKKNSIMARRTNNKNKRKIGIKRKRRSSDILK